MNSLSSRTAKVCARHALPLHATRVVRRHVAMPAASEEASTTATTTATSSSGPYDPRFNGIKVFVAGASGGTGRCIVEALRARNVPVRALVRDPAAAATKLPPAGNGLEIVEGDVVRYATLAPAIGDCNAVVVATGARNPQDPLGPLNVDLNGTLNLIEAAKRAGVEHFVLVSSIGADDLLNPLNLFWGVLVCKQQAEFALARSGLAFTVVRPGGLKSTPGSNGAEGSVVMAPAGTFGFPPMKKSGSILRSQVADVCLEALVCDSAKDKVVEVIAEERAAPRSIADLFASV